MKTTYNLTHEIGDRRSLVRNKFADFFPATCNIKGSDFPCSIQDITHDGIMANISTKPRIKVSDKIIIRFPFNFNSNSSDQEISIAGRIKWKSEFGHGIRMGLEIKHSHTHLPTFIINHLKAITQEEDRRVSKAKIEKDRRLNSKNSSFLLNLSNTPTYRRSGIDRRKIEGIQNQKISRNNIERRAVKPVSSLKQNFFIQSILSVITVTRDLFLYYLPMPLSRLLIGRGDFAFICHPRDFNDVERMFPFAKFFSEKFVMNWFRFQWPFIASRVTCKNPSSDKEIRGWILISPLWTQHMMRDNDLARNKILKTVKLGERIGAKVVGLGAFTSIVTHDGLDVCQKTSIGITTGNPYSAAVAVANLIHSLELIGQPIENSKIAVVGAAGSVGSGCSSAILGKARELCLIDINQPALKKLLHQLEQQKDSKGYQTEISTSKNLDVLKVCDGIVVVTNAIGAIVNETHLKPGTIVIDCAQPKNVSANVPKIRKDVIVIESAIISAENLNCRFDLDLADGEALGCLAESIILSTVEKKKHLTLGKVNVNQMEGIYSTSQELGFTLAYFRNSCGYITEQDIEYVKNIISNKSK